MSRPRDDIDGVAPQAAEPLHAVCALTNLGRGRTEAVSVKVWLVVAPWKGERSLNVT